jgi:hypothetical protein
LVHSPQAAYGSGNNLTMTDTRASVKKGVDEFTSLTKQLFDSLVIIAESRTQFRTETFREPEAIMKDLVIVDQKLQEDVTKRMIRYYSRSLHSDGLVKDEQIFFNMILSVSDKLKEMETEILKLQTSLKRADERIRYVTKIRYSFGLVFIMC